MKASSTWVTRHAAMELPPSLQNLASPGFMHAAAWKFKQILNRGHADNGVRLIRVVESKNVAFCKAAPIGFLKCRDLEDSGNRNDREGSGIGIRP